jgi:hypothetical protein
MASIRTKLTIENSVAGECPSCGSPKASYARLQDLGGYEHHYCYCALCGKGTFAPRTPQRDSLLAGKEIFYSKKKASELREKEKLKLFNI